MLTLALDTTTRTGSVALARDGRVLEETAGDAVQPPAARLPRDLMALLARHGVGLQDIDVFAVATGPGSFTGLRIGIATMQGLAFATGKPLIGVSALDALARIASGAAPTGPVARIATWVDAWRGEVYAACYEAAETDEHEIAPPTVDMPAAVLAALQSDRGAVRPVTWFVGDGAETYREAIVATLGPAAAFADPLTPLLAGTIALLASQAAAAGHTPAPHAIRPLYVRRPDAELARSRARGLMSSSS